MRILPFSVRGAEKFGTPFEPVSRCERTRFAVEDEGESEMTERGKAESSVIGEGFLTLREAAEMLRLSTRTVREYVKRGEIRGKLIGKRWRFRRADLDTFFDNAPSEWDFAGKGSNRD
jgi:excisionase family DNA binding protein